MWSLLCTNVLLTFSSCCLQGYTLTLLQIHPWQRVFSAERGPHYAQTGGCWRRPWMCIRELLKYSSLRRAEKLTKSLERPLFFTQRPRKIETGQKIWVRHGHLGGIFFQRITDFFGHLTNSFVQNRVPTLHKCVRPRWNCRQLTEPFCAEWGPHYAQTGLYQQRFCA